ncbi:MAG: sulfite exporter TauE/SafE family protein [Cyanobacteriota bacterium]|nr:sulfite exporter TauE/SafE family protein [Cyanobacteriota bacterium]
MELTLSSLLPLVPLGLVAGLLSGLLGIGGGLIFSPLLLWLGLPPHQALATSSLAIVLTTLGGSWSHLRSRSLPLGPSLAIGLGSGAAALVFSELGRSIHDGLLLGLQALMYGVLTLVMRPAALVPEVSEPAPPPLAALVGIGLVAGLASGLLGLGGGLVMVPLMVTLLRQPVRLAVRLSTLAVLVAATVAAPVFIGDGRGLLPVALVLGSVAAVGSRWSASRLNRVSEGNLLLLIRSLTALLAIDSGRRALALALG